MNENTHVFMFIFFQGPLNKYLLSDYFLSSTSPSDEDAATNKNTIFSCITDISMEKNVYLHKISLKKYTVFFNCITS